jgi:hypothetical protein
MTIKTPSHLLMLILMCAGAAAAADGPPKYNWVQDMESKALSVLQDGKPGENGYQLQFQRQIAGLKAAGQNQVLVSAVLHGDVVERSAHVYDLVTKKLTAATGQEPSALYAIMFEFPHFGASFVARTKSARFVFEENGKAVRLVTSNADDGREGAEKDRQPPAGADGKPAPQP